ncbi:hypothetical protein BT96DRAFT_970149 [Gymnopus androsaceus JB14]|uniref:Exosome complex protein n=1 Tax=Gymnopus androsaceus JB14 TaxID=1447944 RepID=A0A6A4IF00_9AGAR|nr:hypothetical protein BT96DRAFT_970149 [Gymnopus androsaceus JB14]
MASAETRKAKSKLKVLSSSLDEVEAAIEPLFSGEQTLPEILLALEPLQQAKLQTVLPYLVYDLIFIYLRSRGIDPKSHPVIKELDRTRQYFEKIKNAENPAVRATQVDKAAANRFIKHAISQAQIDADAAGVSYPPKVSTISSTISVATSSSTAGPSNSATVHVPMKVTSKMLEREEWQKRVDEAGSEEQEELEGWEGANEEKAKPDIKGKGKLVATPSIEEVENPGNKRRRPAIDPFAASGYGDDSDHPSESHPAKKQALSPDASTIVDPSSASANSTPATKAQKKSRKKPKAKEVKTDKDTRISQLLAEVAASQGAMVASESGEDNDVDITESGSTPGTPVPSSAGGKKKKIKKGNGRSKVAGRLQVLHCEVYSNRSDVLVSTAMRTCTIGGSELRKKDYMERTRLKKSKKAHTSRVY